jgi:hypothetical protein
MTSSFRMLLIATALLMSGAVQAAAAIGEDACCAEEKGSRPECPAGIACACCPIRGAVKTAAPEVGPSSSPGVAISVAAAEPSLGGSATDIFHPPRA